MTIENWLRIKSYAFGLLVGSIGAALATSWVFVAATGCLK